jgi:hypothetical protein
LGVKVVSTLVCPAASETHAPHLVEPGGRNRYCASNPYPGIVHADHVKVNEVATPPAIGANRGRTLTVPVIGLGSVLVDAYG